MSGRAIGESLAAVLQSRIDAAAGDERLVEVALDLSGRPTARLALGVDAGRYRLAGEIAPSQFLGGKLQRLTAPVVRVRGDGRLEDRVLDGQLALTSRSLRAVSVGAVDLGENRYRRVRLGVDLLRPNALFPNMTGRNVRMVWTLDGPFGRADYSYRLTSPGPDAYSREFVRALTEDYLAPQLATLLKAEA